MVILCNVIITYGMLLSWMVCQHTTDSFGFIVQIYYDQCLLLCWWIVQSKQFSQLFTFIFISIFRRLNNKVWNVHMFCFIQSKLSSDLLNELNFVQVKQWVTNHKWFIHILYKTEQSKWRTARQNDVIT